MKDKMTYIKTLFFFISLFVVALSAQQLFAQDSSGAGKAKITISFSTEDSSHTVVAKLTNADTAVKGIDIHFYIKKSFGSLPLEGDFTTTDENGDATVDFPTDIPGDATGNVIVIARVEDDENLGSVEATKTINWGVPLKADQSKTPPRALWSSANNAPWPLTITVTSLVFIVWGIILYICYQLVVIKKAGKYKA